LVVTAVTGLAGCASGGAEPALEMRYEMAAEAPAAMEPAPAAVDMVQSTIAQSGEVLAPQAVEPDPRKIIYTGNISIVVKDPAAAAQQVEQLAAEVGGYVAQSQLSQYTGDLMRGMVVIRVPVAGYQQVLDQIRALGVRVLSENSNASDVTSEYTDLEAQLRNLEAAEKELAAMLAEVRARPNAKPADILEVYNALTQKRGEIEQVKGRLQYLANQVSLSTITVDLVPDEVTKPVVEEGWQPLATLKNASRTLVNILQGLVDLLITVLVVVVPVLLVVAVPIVLVILVVRWLLRRRRQPAPPTA
jgi:hypothetical protein